MLKHLIVAVLLFMAHYVSIANTMKCHYCSSSMNGPCSTAPERLGLVDCDAPYEGIDNYAWLEHNTRATGCRKRITTYTLNPEVKNVVRDCYYGDLKNTEDSCLEAWPNWTPMISIVDCHVCDSDGCNGATQRLASLAALTLLAILSVAVGLTVY